MSIRGMIFDLDGTLIDTNPAHVEAWRRALQRYGFDVPASRIVPEIGKGGDKLVPSVLGDQVEQEYGEALRKAQKEEFIAIAGRERFRVFPGAVELFSALRQRGIRTALATSSDQKHLEATFASAGVDLRPLADVVVTRTPREPSKPSPDLVVDAVEQLSLRPVECAMVGDTIYDAQACVAAGVVFLGVLSGPATEPELFDAGAIAVWPDVGHLLRELERALELASLPGAAIR
jgi:phosphoglycolate phosphatase-like HAD superfamily hydrolase